MRSDIDTTVRGGSTVPEQWVAGIGLGEEPGGAEGESVLLSSRAFGGVRVGRLLYEELGIGEILRGLERPRRRRHSHETPVFAIYA